MMTILLSLKFVKLVQPYLKIIFLWLLVVGCYSQHRYLDTRASWHQRQAYEGPETRRRSYLTGPTTGTNCSQLSPMFVFNVKPGLLQNAVQSSEQERRNSALILVHSVQVHARERIHLVGDQWAWKAFWLVVRCERHSVQVLRRPTSPGCATDDPASIFYWFAQPPDSCLNFLEVMNMCTNMLNGKYPFYQGNTEQVECEMVFRAYNFIKKDSEMALITMSPCLSCRSRSTSLVWSIQTRKTVDIPIWNCWRRQWADAEEEDERRAACVLRPWQAWYLW